MWKDPNNIAITVLAIAAIVMATMLATAKPQVRVEYIPYEVVVDNIIQTETIAVPDEALAELVQEALGENFDEIMDHIQALDMEVAALAQLSASGQGSSISTPIVDETGSITPVQEELNVAFEEVEVPVAEVQVTEEGVLNARAYDLDLELNTIITESDTGALSTVSGLTLFSEGNPYAIPIEGTTYYNLRPPDKPDRTRRFNLWDPHIDLSIDAGLWSNPFRFRPGASLGFSTSSIRRGELPVWRFVRVGVGFSTDQNPYFSLSPATYNLGRNLPVFDDLWLGPGVGINTEGSYIITLGIGTTL